MTITEALAELKTLGKRIDKKREYIGGYLARQDGMKDPLAKDGGSVEVITRERQALADLAARHVAIRTAIQRVNHATTITVAETTKTIAEWLTWRKEIAPGEQAFVNKVRNTIVGLRNDAQKKGIAVLSVTTAAEKLTDIIVNVDEAALAAEAERMEVILSTLDGQLSLKNATVMVEV